MGTFLHYLWLFYIVSALLASPVIVFRFDEIKDRVLVMLIQKRKLMHRNPRQLSSSKTSLAVIIVMFLSIMIPGVNTVIAFVYWRAVFLSLFRSLVSK